MTTAAKPLFELHGWKVEGPNDDEDTYGILDELGDCVDEATSLEDAVESCTKHATDSYRARLWEFITEVDPDDFPLYMLETIADMFGRTKHDV